MKSFFKKLGAVTVLVMALGLLAPSPASAGCVDDFAGNAPSSRPVVHVDPSRPYFFADANPTTVLVNNFVDCTV